MKLAQLGQSIKRCAVRKDHPPSSICNRGKTAAHRTAATKERHPRSYSREEQHPMGKRQLPMTAQAFPHTHPHPEAPAWDSTTCTLSTGRLNQPIPVSRRRQAKSTWGNPSAGCFLSPHRFPGRGALCSPHRAGDGGFRYQEPGQRSRPTKRYAGTDTNVKASPSRMYAALLQQGSPMLPWRPGVPCRFWQTPAPGSVEVPHT